ncbi:hypothetical protein [Streptomyces lasiicapitis]|uniref:hypothetical protein n=1 Tax=Streptomyces lasiicapitis TaxID=1923961 RepID=UPI0036B39C95
MSVLQDLRTRARHRGYTPWQLIQKIGLLEREAEDRTCRMIGMATQIDELTEERNRYRDDFDRAAGAYSGILEDLRDVTAEAAALRSQLAPYLAAEANANAVSLPPLERDTSNRADQATEPIPVITLQQAHGIGPVLNPGQTAWGAARETTEGVAS